MKTKAEHTMTPVQPYLLIDTEGYKKISVNQNGISHFYEFSIDSGFENKLQAVPDGSVDLLFGIGENEVHTYIGGTVLKVKKWPMDAGKIYFGVRFEPGQYQLPEDLGISDIVNHDLEIDGDSYGKGLTEELAVHKNISERADVFLKYYWNNFAKTVENDAKKRIENYVRNRIYETNGNISMKQLSEETGYSECYIRRVFEKIHGISPKVFEKFVRFQNVLNQLDTCHLKMEEVALNCGYYDQSHMIKDFKNYSGITPEKYMNLFSLKTK